MTKSSIVYVLTPFLGWIVAQTIKIYLCLRKDGITWHDTIQSGGMPSSHAAFMISLTTLIAIGVGITSVAFAISLALSAIIIYDSTGVRRTTGEQTDAFKKLAKKVGSKIDIKHDARGHTPAEALAGVAVGMIVGIMTSIFL